MMSYIIFILVFFYILDSFNDFLTKKSEKIPEKIGNFNLIKIRNFFQKKEHEIFFAGFFVMSIFFLPFIYEFPRLTDSYLGIETYILKNDESKKGSFTIEKLNWYGNFQKIRSPRCVELISSNESSFVLPIKKIKISDLVSKKNQIFEVSFSGKNHKDFILAIYNSSDELYPDSSKKAVTILYNSISRALQESSEELNIESVRVICDNWLDKHDIPAKTSVVSVNETLVPNRVVDILE